MRVGVATRSEEVNYIRVGFATRSAEVNFMRVAQPTRTAEDNSMSDRFAFCAYFSNSLIISSTDNPSASAL